MKLRTKMILGCCVPVLLVTILAVVTTVRVKSAIETYNWSEHAQAMVENEKDDSERALGLHKTEIGKKIMGELHMMTGTSAAIFVISLVMSVFFSGRFIRSLRHVIEGIMESSEQIGSASGDLSSGNQQLAERTSDQASSIEETSSSLEEMSSMTKQNADNANQADHLMNDSKQIVKTANESMVELTASMEDISKASEETSKIIKTIDEIAFQTNLLALNAAVEAARAGEAGAGFAVVAEEVRNLAMRAAEAARNTSELIEGTVKRIKEGSELVAKTNEHFTSVAASTIQVGELVSEIAGTSNEQAQGIEQVNRSVSQMDQTIQQNAANAEESASASEEMNTRVEDMKEYVEELIFYLLGENIEKRTVVQNGSGKLERPVLNHLPTKRPEPVPQQMTLYKKKKSGRSDYPNG